MANTREASAKILRTAEGQVVTISGKALLLHHLDHTFEKEAMQPSLSDAVRGLTAAQAAWKPSPERHSIWQIVRHVSLWKQAAVSALDGSPLDYDEPNRMDWQEVDGDQRAWEADIERLRSISRELRARLEAMDEARLTKEIRWYKQSRSPQPIAIRLQEIATHDSYHSGQIQYVFALQEIPVEELTTAASRNDIRRLVRLLEKNEDVINRYSRDGWTALHVGTYFGQREAVQFLLEHGASANVTSKNAEAKTPLHLAITGIANRSELVRILLKNGADANGRDANGNTPLDLARQQEDMDLVDVLRGGAEAS